MKRREKGLKKTKREGESQGRRKRRGHGEPGRLSTCFDQKGFLRTRGGHQRGSRPLPGMLAQAFHFQDFAPSFHTGDLLGHLDLTRPALQK